MPDLSKYVQAQDFKLAGSGVSLTATSITLSSFAQIDGTLLTMTDFGDLGYGTIEPGTSKEEQITFSGVTQNGDGSATLTGVTRGVRMVAPYDQDLAIRQQHAGGTIFRISNTAAFYSQFPALDNDETVTGKWTFPGGGDANAPVSGTSYSAPTDPLEYSSKQYIDNEITAVTVGAVPAFVVTQNGADPSLNIDVSAGEFMVGNDPKSFAAVVSFAMTPSSTNYVQIDATGTLIANTTGFVDDHLPIAEVTTDPTDIISIVDKRVWLTLASDDQMITTAYTYGDTIAIGDLLYLDTADGKWKLTDANGVAAQGTLTLGGALPLDTETVTIGTQTYTFNTVLGGADSVLLGASVNTAIDNLINAIIGGPGVGVVYGVGTAVNTSVSASVGGSPNIAIMTALTPGSAGNSIVTTDTFSDGANAFDGATLGTTTLGVDGNAFSDNTHGVALDAGVDTDTDKRVQLGGVVTNVAGLSTAGLQYVSNTIGEVSNTQGDYKKVVGFSPDGSTMIVNLVPRIEDLAGTNADTSTANFNESMTFFANTDITGAEAETLTAGPTSDASALHTHTSSSILVNYLPIEKGVDNTFGGGTVIESGYLITCTGPTSAGGTLGATGIPLLIGTTSNVFDLRIEVSAFTVNGVNSYIFYGFDNTGTGSVPVNPFVGVYEDSTTGGIVARCIDGGGTTDVVVASAPARIVYTPGTSADYYDSAGALLTSITTNVPNVAFANITFAGAGGVGASNGVVAYYKHYTQLFVQ